MPGRRTAFYLLAAGRVRRRGSALWSAAVCIGAFLQQASAQALIFFATDEAGNPAVTARAEVVPDAFPDVPALRDASPLLPTVTAQADGRGLVRVPVDRPGLALLTTPAGLGGLVLRADRNRAIRVRLQPMAALKVAPGAQVFAASVDARSGERRRLPARTADADGEVRLPAGRYEIFWHDGTRLGWGACTARSGQPTRLDEMEITPARRPLPPAATGTRLRPCGAFDLVVDPVAGAWPAMTPTAGAADFFAEDDRTGALRLLSLHSRGRRDLRVALAVGPAARAFVLEGLASGSYRVFSGRNVPESRNHPIEVDLTVPTGDGNDWLLVVEPGQAVVAVPLREASDSRPVERPAQRTLACTIRRADGEPVPSTSLQFEVTDGGPVTAVAYTDERGKARLGPIHGSGFVRVEADDFVSVSVPVAREESLPVDVVLHRGAALRGRAVFADGSPAGIAAISVRAPDGSMRPASRSAACAADGTFAFAGLDPRTRLIAFASAVRDGHTFTAQREVSAGGEPVELILRDEDPELLPPGREGR